jgi:hypothetical protein
MILLHESQRAEASFQAYFTIRLQRPGWFCKSSKFTEHREPVLELKIFYYINIYFVKFPVSGLARIDFLEQRHSIEDKDLPVRAVFYKGG